MFSSLECYWWPSSFSKHTMENSKNKTYARRCVLAIYLSFLCTALFQTCQVSQLNRKSHDFMTYLTLFTSCNWFLMLLRKVKLQKHSELQGLSLISKLDIDRLRAQSKENTYSRIWLQFLLAYHDLLLIVKTQYFSCLKMAANKTQKLQNLNHKIDCDV